MDHERADGTTEEGRAAIRARLAELRGGATLLVKCSAESHAPKVTKIATYEETIDLAKGGVRTEVAIVAGGYQPDRKRGYPVFSSALDPAGRPFEHGRPFTEEQSRSLTVLDHGHVQLRCPLCGLTLRGRSDTLDAIIEQLIDDGESEIELLDLRRRYS